MTDIVERMRSPKAWFFAKEAADEIERLREEGTVELAKAMLENERLREALQAMMDGEPGCVLLARRALRLKP